MLMCMEMVKRMLRNQKGQGMAEYGLILALIAVAAIGAFTLMQTGLVSKLTTVGNELSK